VSASRNRPYRPLFFCTALLFSVLVSACLDERVAECADGRMCPAGMACDLAHQGCVLPQQLETCARKAEGASCSYRGVPRGACYEEVCLPAGCGNGILDGGEACDDGNRVHGDGCSADCRSNEVCGNGVVDVTVGESCERAAADDAWCRTDCVSVRCGDGVLDKEAFEVCDEGVHNSDKPDARCRPNCQPQRCGDGVRDSGEICDDGNRLNGDHCSSDCMSDETCGNGVVDTAAGESCDPGNGRSAAWCRSNCVSVRCGDGVIDGDSFERCDDGALNSNAPDAPCRPNCQPQRCGDGVRDSGEVCDDGNARSGDACAADCLSDETCGNGVVDAAIGESCEPNASNERWCRANCVNVTCGDGVLDSDVFEQCDEGKNNSAAPNATCRPNCQYRRCGDGIQDSDEACDDGNQYDRDGCSHDCKSREICGNGYADLRVGETCDDGNFLSHDGCSSSCQGEAPAWRVAVASMFQPAEMAYDGTRDVVVLSSLSRTYELHGQAWQLPEPHHLPTIVTDSGTTWDSARRRVVLFGGGIQLESNETWEWDGRDWERRIPLTRSPHARWQPTLAYDPVRQRTIMLGGHYMVQDPDTQRWSTIELFDTWEWDGSDWHELPTDDGLPGGKYAATYDPVAGHVVAFNGKVLSYLEGSTWRSVPAPLPIGERPFTRSLVFDADEGRLLAFSAGDDYLAPQYSLFEWDGSAWQARESPPGPMDFAAKLIYRSARRRLTLLTTNDIWEWDGSTWRRTGSFDQPPERARSALVYDPLRGSALLFGGSAGTDAWLSDTWIWNEGTWSEQRPRTVPPAREQHAMAYDPVAREVVMFGGLPNFKDPALGDTWLWNGEDWREASPADAPSPRPGHAMTYDAQHERVVLFGGGQYDANGQPHFTNDLWTWDGNTWTEQKPTDAPVARGQHGLSYDPIRRELVMTAGGGDLSLYADSPTWTWNGERWQALAIPGLTYRTTFAMPYDANRKATLIISGDYADNVHSWVLPAVSASEPALAWEALPILFSRDPQVWGPNAVYDPLQACTLVFSSDENRTWELRYRADTGLDEVCQVGFDIDGDGLVGCDDPDCWGYCTPLCPPGTECDPELPRCGDGTCNTFLETCRMCPEDCGACEPLCGDFFCDPGESIASCPGDCMHPLKATQ
jgi:cysteine-rich repeat protein